MAAITLVACLALVPATAPRAAKLLRWSDAADAASFDPHARNGRASASLLRQVYEPLIRRGVQMQKLPALAISWKLTQPTRWDFRLRKGVSFHDGSAFTAADVVFSLDRARQAPSAFADLLAGVKEIRASGVDTVQIVTASPDPILPDRLSEVLIMSASWARKHAAQKPQDVASEEPGYAARHASGTGAFLLASRARDVRTVLERNPIWWGWGEFKGNAERLVQLPLRDPATRTAGLLAGELELALDLPEAQLQRLAAAPGVKLPDTVGTGSLFLGMDQGSPALRIASVKGANPFADRRVREALYQAIDAPVLASRVLGGRAVPAGMLAAPAVHGYSPALDARLPHDPHAARRLLGEAGYADGFSVTLDCPGNADARDEAVCRAVAGMLAEVGIAARVDLQPPSVHLQKIERRQTDLYLLAFAPQTLDSQEIFAALARHDARLAATGYHRESLERSIDAIATEMDLAARDRMIAEVWSTLKQDIVYLPLLHPKVVWAAADSLALPVYPDGSPRWFSATLQ